MVTKRDICHWEVKLKFLNISNHSEKLTARTVAKKNNESDIPKKRGNNLQITKEKTIHTLIT